MHSFPLVMTPIVLQTFVSTNGVLICILFILLIKFCCDTWKVRAQEKFIFERMQNESIRLRKPCNKIKNQYIVSRAEIYGRLNNTPRRVCNCSQIHNFRTEGTAPFLAESICSDEATLLGKSQKVISYSLFYKPKSSKNKMADIRIRYIGGVPANLAGMKKHYPGWVMRIYSNIPLKDEMCDLVCSDNDLYYCDVSQLPIVGDVRHIHPMTWRFLLIGDPTVEKFAIRDLDSRLSQRERDAVGQWEMTRFAIHGMRDHPWHTTSIMGGMWGADNYKLCLTTGATIRKKLLKPLWEMIKYNDQQIINDVIYLKYRSTILTHDSYLCNWYKDSVPFPTKRPNAYEYVGLVYVENFNTTLEKHCPVECRPDHGKDWDYC